MILVVGGHSRNIGKTSVVAGIIRALSEHSWTAVKITQFGHGVCSAGGETCECSTDPDHPYALTRETSSTSGTDTARYLAAGARESLWLRTRQRELGFAMPALRRVVERAPFLILESNSVLQFLRPDLYLAVLDPAIADFKDSSRLYLDRVDAFLLPEAIEKLEASPWPSVATRLLSGRPLFQLQRAFQPDAALLDFIRARRFDGPSRPKDPA
jgi:molybdopterin-guanine dinucleotide biosynthesis protein